MIILINLIREELGNDFTKLESTALNSTNICIFVKKGLAQMISGKQRFNINLQMFALPALRMGLVT